MSRPPLSADARVPSSFSFPSSTLPSSSDDEGTSPFLASLPQKFKPPPPSLPHPKHYRRTPLPQPPSRPRPTLPTSSLPPSPRNRTQKEAKIQNFDRQHRTK
ncbi:hypothetical protein Salat_2430800 [Sesamum alatum]|uniref:Uncharacterized protein n=1 Tax=Sesamum alatum TaxID=300844 RepID=A0AAE1XYW3_9LAMI|nr:hypothetical protein Salat_2430800 [Sesamum alatum]